ncbi:MAG: phosphate acyltransferase [Porticoccus sp.]|jgi:glycerol-3-phosphate acyltransferase PlsX|nr:phosphate acyltransferase [Porticoccus sp.]|tara:strand:+ start:58838 stop:59821 length:984 start_codon:yes stop_codon:yes gene_type:complete
MGGDFGPRVTVPATLDILRQQPNLRVVLFGDEQQIQQQLRLAGDHFPERLKVRHCPQFVSMDDKPSFALRNKRDSSMWLAIEHVANKQAAACVSAGNTGALMAMSLFQLGALPGINRPAIGARIPTARGFTYLLDMGANLECTAEQLYQFGLIASLVVAEVDGNTNPAVGLLNIGVESLKGKQEILDAAALFKTNPDIHYIGFVEADALFNGEADIVVCDGFSGNIALKAGEGVAKLLQKQIKDAMSETVLARLGALFLKPALGRLLKRVDPARYNGASFLGLQGVVIKSHGSADQWGFARAVEVALHEAERDLPTLVEKRLSENNQ